MIKLWKEIKQLPNAEAAAKVILILIAILIIGVMLLPQAYLYYQIWEIKRDYENRPKSPRVALSSEQEWKLYLFEKSLSWGSFTLLRAIAEAESSWRQYDSEGNVLRGQDGKDVGLFQIRETIHLTKAKELGFDIYTPEGNINYALYLYSENYTDDWTASKSRWAEIVRR